MIQNIQLINNGMGEDSFQILTESTKRFLELRSVGLVPVVGSYRVTLLSDPAFLNERYRIVFTDQGAEITAGTEDCTFHAAVGRLLSEIRFDGIGGAETPAAGKTVDFTPSSPVRGMYFATHFYNFYHAAPLKKVYEVIDDLAFRGCNSILVWFDMHHFTSMHDPNAKELVERLHAIISYANRIGMSGSMMMLGNEAFSSSPEELRAEWRPIGKYRAEPRGHYHVEICPNKEGGLEEILRERREMLFCFADLNIRYVCYWPYDQGGCTCEKCQPWGANGFIKILTPFRKLINEYFPKAELIFSTWFFDRFIDGEWDAFYPLMKTPLFDGIRYVMAFFFDGNMPACIEKNGIPEGIRFVDFTEISMYSCQPWGGYGASVLTAFLNETNRLAGRLYSGGFPYSEGIFEDANKFIQLGYYSGLYPNAEDALRAYVRTEFCCADEELYEAIRKTETALARDQDCSGEQCRCKIKNPGDIEFVYNTLEKYRKILPPKIAASPKFRLFWLRAVIDYELMQNDYYPIRSERCQEAMREVNKIYYADGRTDRYVSAPVGI